MKNIFTFMVCVLIFLPFLRGEAQTRIQYGQNIQASVLTPAELDRYVFTANAGDIITLLIAKSSGSSYFVPTVEIRKSDNSLFKVLQGSTIRFDTTLVEDEDYSIRVSDDNLVEGGNYGLSLLRLNPAMGVTIYYDTTLSHDISGVAQINSYKFCGKANDILTMLLAKSSGSSYFSPTIEIYRPNGLLFKKAQGSTIRIDTILSESGLYTIWILDDNGVEGGNYGLGLKRLNPQHNGVKLHYDTTVQHSIEIAGQIKSYRFCGITNDNFSLMFAKSSGSSYFVPIVEIYKPDGALLKKFQGSTIRIDTILSESGLYTIWILDDNGVEGGTYGLGLSRLNPPMGIGIKDTSLQNSISAPAKVNAYRFCGKNNDFLTILFAKSSGSSYFVPIVEIYKPGGILLNRFQGSTIRLDTTLDETGVYTIRIYDDNAVEGGNYGLTLIGVGSDTTCLRDMIGIDSSCFVDSVIDTACSVLPVSWLYFKAQPYVNDAILTWATTQEENTLKFLIERSLDGKQFAPIASIPARGNSVLVTSYEFRDIEAKSLKSVAVYYRLRQVDIDGKFKYSKIVRVSFLNRQGLVLSPNPTRNSIILRLSGVAMNGEASMFIMDMTGRKLLSKTILLQRGDNVFPVSVESLSKGVYLLVLETSPGNKWESKFVKE